MSTALLLGEALVDRLPSGPVAAGAPLNVARHLRQLGAAPMLVTRIGAGDADAARIETAMRAADLSMAGVQRDPQHPTGAVDVLMDERGAHRFVIHDNAAWDHINAAQARPLLHALRPPLAYFGTLAQRAEPSRSSIRTLLAEHEGLRYLDLNLREGVGPELAEASLRLAHWVKISDDELAQLGRWWGLTDGPAVVRAFGLQRLVVTRGPQGYAAWDAQGRLLAEGPGVALERFADTVGAGDAFSAVLLAAHLAHKSFPASLSLANAFAAALCGETGAAPAHPADFYPRWRAQLEGLPA